VASQNEEKRELKFSPLKMLITLRYFFSIFQNVIFGFSLNGSPFKPRHWSSLNICLHNRNSLPLHEFFFLCHPLPWGIYCHSESVGIGGSSRGARAEAYCGFCYAPITIKTSQRKLRPPCKSDVVGNGNQENKKNGPK